MPPLAQAGPANATDRTLVATVLLALLLSQVVSVALGFWHPDGNLVPYIEAHRDSWWAWHMYSGLVFVATAGAHAALFWWLVPAKGRAIALAGGLLTAVGTATFGAGLIAEASTHWYATASPLSSTESHELLMYIDDEGTHLVIPILAGLILSTIGPLVAAVGLWMSGLVRLWLLALFVVGNVASIAFGPAGILSALAYAVLCWMAWQRFGLAASPEPELAAVSAANA